MNRVYAGADVSLTYDVGSAGEAYTAKFVDAKNRYLKTTVTESAPNVTITVGNDQWSDGSTGRGRVEIIKDVSGVKTVVKSERVLIMPGLEADYLGSGGDYGR